MLNRTSFPKNLHMPDPCSYPEADPDGGAGGARPHLAKKRKVVDLLLRACTWHALQAKGTTFFICVSRPAHALISASGEKKKNKKISKKMRTSGQVRVDKCCPQQSQRNRQIARRKQEYYGD